MKKTYLAVISLLSAAGKYFMNLLTDRKAVGSTQKYYLLAGDLGFYFYPLATASDRNEK